MVKLLLESTSELYGRWAWTCIGILRRRDENPRRGSTEQGGSLAEMGVAEGNGAMP